MQFYLPPYKLGFLGHKNPEYLGIIPPESSDQCWLKKLERKRSIYKEVMEMFANKKVDDGDARDYLDNDIVVTDDKDLYNGSLIRL